MPMRRIILAALLLCLAWPALAQPAVPALPDTERRTSYSISASPCGCAIGFQLYADGTDIDNWITVWVNGVRRPSTDPTFGWFIQSPTGPIGTIPRPITDGVLVFNNVQTATIQIVGAARPRRLTTFAENQGITARSFNQTFNTVFAELRETWDKINAMTGRGFFYAPGNVTGPMPAPAACANMVLGFDATGLNPTCTPGGGGGGAVSSVTNSDGTLTITPTTGAVVASLALGHANAWTNQQTFTGLRVAVRSASTATVTINATSDYLLCLDPTSNAIAANLPASPANGLTYLIKDCTGQAATHNITVTPAAGNIDGSATFVMNTNFQSIAVTYTGAQWSIN